MEILRVEDLKFAYRIRSDKQALDGVSFALNRGDLLCVCGATGGGKSTLLKMLKKELTPSGEKSGRVLICGKSPDEMSERESAATVGFVMQRPEQQIVTDKVWHELAFGLENLAVPQKEIRRRVSEIAGYFGIESWFEMNTDELSGGQKQLLNLAAVMVMQPEILVLDEPTAQLDPIAASNFIATVVKLNRELALTVVIVEHRLEDIIPVSDKLLVLEDGKVRAFGPTRECVG
ncbi:MAG: ABC transporter ATP-binding protein, partial [Lachnospiraceae bacterium]|nr:ABC transporter ATP-binding protein [Lachnospiraceae bacterium]